MFAPTTAAELPHFTTLFTPDATGSQPQASWRMTPRTALDLWTVLNELRDMAEEDAESLADAPLTPHCPASLGTFERLPRLTWSQGRDWRSNFAAACGYLAGDLEAGHWPAPTCPAEEMALYLAFEDLGPTHPEALDDLGGDLRSYDLTEEQHRTLPAHRDDYDWDSCADLLLEDSDILLLFNDENEAIANPAHPANKDLGIGDLRPAAWFTPFNTATRNRIYLQVT